MHDSDKLVEEINKTVQILKAGGVILYPTDTIWGLGCDATNTKAIKKIFNIKRRTASKSLIILAESAKRIQNHVDADPELIKELIHSFDKPTTIIYDGAKNLAKNVIAQDKTIAIRYARHEFCQKLITQLDKPIVSTSANISGEPAPIQFSQISQEIIENVDYVVDLEQDILKDVKPSTLIKLHENGIYDVLRP